MPCKYCEDRTADISDFHKPCYNELLRRLADGYCTRCGKPKLPGGNAGCAECAGKDDPPFTGYPGGD